MNTKHFLRLGVSLGEATRRPTDFVAKLILGGGDKSRLREQGPATTPLRDAVINLLCRYFERNKKDC
jgi:hypothetical protein